MQPEVNLNLTSLGRLAVDLQMPPARLLKIAARLGLKPTLVLNDVSYFDLEAIEKLYSARRIPPGASIAQM